MAVNGGYVALGVANGVTSRSFTLPADAVTGDWIYLVTYELIGSTSGPTMPAPWVNVVPWRMNAVQTGWGVWRRKRQAGESLTYSYPISISAAYSVGAVMYLHGMSSVVSTASGAVVSSGTTVSTPSGTGKPAGTWLAIYPTDIYNGPFAPNSSSGIARWFTAPAVGSGATELFINVLGDTKAAGNIPTTSVGFAQALRSGQGAYLTIAATTIKTVSPGDAMPADPEVTSEADAPMLYSLGYRSSIPGLWPAGQYFTIGGTLRFYWTGSDWMGGASPPATLMRPTCELWIDGRRYPDGSAGDIPGAWARSGLRVNWGRTSSLDQPNPSTCTFSVLDISNAGQYATIALGSKVTVWAAMDGIRRPVFVGRVTDLEAQYDRDSGGANLDVVAADISADLANRFVGSGPWGASAMWQRAVNILTEAISPGRLVIEPNPGPADLFLASITNPSASITVSKQDVDRQPAWPLVQDLTISTFGVLWSTATDDGTPLVILENLGDRRALNVFRLGGDGLWRPIKASGTTGAAVLDVCELLEEPARWYRDVTSLVTRVAVRWLEQTTPDTTERTYTIVNSDQEAIYGARGVSVGTKLTTDTDASNLAAALTASHQPTNTWQADGLEWDLGSVPPTNDPAVRKLVIDLLGARSRLGLAIMLTNLPLWIPAAGATSVYVEGGTYSFVEGIWKLELLTSSATGFGHSMTFAETDPAATYDKIDPVVTYLDMIGVGP